MLATNDLSLLISAEWVSARQMFFRAEGVRRVDGVEQGEEAKREYPHATRNYSYYPAYSKFRRLNEFDGVNGLNGVAVIARPIQSI